MTARRRLAIELRAFRRLPVRLRRDVLRLARRSRNRKERILAAAWDAQQRKAAAEAELKRLAAEWGRGR